MSKEHSIPFHGYRLHESFLLPITPAMSTPTMSTLATWCRDVHSRDFSAPTELTHLSNHFSSVQFRRSARALTLSSSSLQPRVPAH